VKILLVKHPTSITVTNVAEVVGAILNEGFLICNSYGFYYKGA